MKERMNSSASMKKYNSNDDCGGGGGGGGASNPMPGSGGRGGRSGRSDGEEEEPVPLELDQQTSETACVNYDGDEDEDDNDDIIQAEVETFLRRMKDAANKLLFSSSSTSSCSLANNNNNNNIINQEHAGVFRDDDSDQNEDMEEEDEEQQIDKKEEGGATVLVEQIAHLLLKICDPAVVGGDVLVSDDDGGIPSSKDDNSDDGSTSEQQRAEKSRDQNYLLPPFHNFFQDETMTRSDMEDLDELERRARRVINLNNNGSSKNSKRNATKGNDDDYDGNDDPMIVDDDDDRNTSNTNTNTSIHNGRDVVQVDLPPKQQLNYYYRPRKIDYLRKLLRVLAPASFDVAIQVAMIVSSNTNNRHEEESRTGSTYQQQRQQELSCLILFSHWLPVAPHLTTLVTELFQVITTTAAKSSSSAPNTNNNNNENNRSWLRTTAMTWIVEGGSSNGDDTGATMERKMKHMDTFILVEAVYQISFHYHSRGEISTICKLWDCAFLVTILKEYQQQQQQQHQYIQPYSSLPFNVIEGIQWYITRTLVILKDWKPNVAMQIYDKWSVSDEFVPWRIHPWEIDREELLVERATLAELTSSETIIRQTNRQQHDRRRRKREIHLWNVQSDDDIVQWPTSERVHKTLRYQPTNYLSRMGPGITVYRQGSLIASSKGSNHLDKSFSSSSSSSTLVPTETTRKNLALLAVALYDEPHPPPILVCGPHGSGKSSLVRELLRECRVWTTSGSSSLLEFHIDEETDSKTLIGSYTTTDIPGEFAWRAGPLTHAAREGRWILIEDLDTVPVEIQAALAKLFEERRLPLGNGTYERCHPNFRIFATCTTTPQQLHSRTTTTTRDDGAGDGNADGRRTLRFGHKRGGGRHILNPSYWRKVHVQPLPVSELQEIASVLHSSVPVSVILSALNVLKSMDQSGRSLGTVEDVTSSADQTDGVIKTSAGTHLRSAVRWTGGRLPSVRDFFKLLSRISNGICFEKDTVYTTEAQRTLCLSECVDVFVGSCPDLQSKMDFVAMVVAPIWGISSDLAVKYIHDRQPTVQMDERYAEIGRARIESVPSDGFHCLNESRSTEFAHTNHSLRLMESIAVCVRENEPVLLVGETGCGKTTVIQQLASICGSTLVVQNLSLQTDSTDLLGGYRPLELQNVARKMYRDFVDIFVSTFSRKQNLKFLEFAASMFEKGDWKKLSKCFQRAAGLGVNKMRERSLSDQEGSQPSIKTWLKFSGKADRFEKQRLSCDAGLAFEFAEGALVDAVQSGKWVLLDEINLASSDTLQRLCGLLDDPTGSVTLTERGDATAIVRHPNFRLFAAMNPATDAGKKDLPSSIRGRFSELYVDELLDSLELRLVASRYLSDILPEEGKAPEHTEIVATVVDLYLKCRSLAESTLVDGSGHKPRYTLRTLSRALRATKALVLSQRVEVRRALLEGFQLAFEGTLDSASFKAVQKTLTKALVNDKKVDLDHPGRRPGGKGDSQIYELIKPFWIKGGTKEKSDWSEVGEHGKKKFILTKSVTFNLRRLSRSLAAGPWPILLEGPTSSGKTTLVEYIAARCGHHVVRINNHEHTDVQEYTGSFAADQNGSLSFRDGILVQALRRGHWVILDELNLAPTEVLEALNRLLDDNRELYLAETNETITPHPNFRLFATQNPSGVYGGRKPLSRAFRNRFVEIYVADIPSDEMVTILEKRCGAPPSHAKLLVKIMVDLRRRRSKNNVFLGKDSFITPRDLLRWAERHCGSKQDLASQGYMLLAERLRSEEEKKLVQDVIEEHTKCTINLEETYYSVNSEAQKLLKDAIMKAGIEDDDLMRKIAPTRSLLRLICLVMNCLRQKEPVLLVGDTGCGKTTVVQLLSFVLGSSLHAINCHATTETADLLGGLRPVRGRIAIKREMILELKVLLSGYALSGDESTTVDFERFSSLDEESINAMSNTEIEPFDADEMLRIGREIVESRSLNITSERLEDSPRTNKRRKLADSSSSPTNENCGVDSQYDVKAILSKLENLARRYNSLFEWFDGPLVRAMRNGDMILLDEMSLAEDAVLERLNSVLEPSRTLVLAEKGDDSFLESTSGDDRIIVAHDGFRIFATMNPGGDFGKRELSPALRSRFTEIWVPAITAREDFEIVLGRSMVAMNDNIGVPPRLASASILKPMLDYVDWFNSVATGEAGNPFSGHSLSLRDVVTWAQFITATLSSDETKVMPWDAFFHGACLMHLDGLGLGSGMAQETSAQLKQQSQNFLLSLVPTSDDVANRYGVDESFGIQDGRFGASPYFIPVGKESIGTATFNMGAPTTSLNTFRVLRAMQLKKPILLEGSPGVGKTSLICALASASGHRLVRINLSEQTDIADLMGSDLPVPNSAGKDGPSFEWRDGVLLTAIKEGSWVLLDEINLASQAVLEGLNSCLDHRASVYIPELAKSYACPPTFRVFAAQNPLGQGGGRKGLPKSFLNRFTKVFVDALSVNDMEAIVSSRFPKIPKEQVKRAIAFNNEIHRSVVDLREFGFNGSPWEFNLRDVFRWFELLESQDSTYEACARDLYYQRFRTQSDRTKVNSIFQLHFPGQTLMIREPPLVTLSESSISIGQTKLERSTGIQPYTSNPVRAEPHLRLMHSLPMEAVARCIQMSWPCLVTGANGSGKTAVISALAEMCNTELIEHSLTPSSDVADLVGGFEQFESSSHEISTIQFAADVAESVLADDAFTASKTESCMVFLDEVVQTLDEYSLESSHDNLVAKALDAALKLYDELATVLDEMPPCDDALRSDVLKAQESLSRISTSRSQFKSPDHHGDGSSHFVWRDGVLVEAMTKGHWLLLDNVNLCPSSVLDRLNSVTEPGGFLLLSEAGTQDEHDSQNSHRMIRPHRNFRIFLSMDPVNGEISRAMRNRCVEVALLDLSSQDQREKDESTTGLQVVDAYDSLRDAGLRSVDLATAVFSCYNIECIESSREVTENPCWRHIVEMVRVLHSLLTTGVSSRAALQSFAQVAFEFGSTISGKEVVSFLQPQDNRVLLSLPCTISVREACSYSGSLTKALEQSRLLAACTLKSESPIVFLQKLHCWHDAGAPVEPQVNGYSKWIQNLEIYLSQVLVLDLDPLQSIFCTLKGLRCKVAFMMKWMALVLLARGSSKGLIRSGRQLKQLFVENLWLRKVQKRNSMVESSDVLTALEASYCMDEDLLDKSKSNCQLTQFLYPFFTVLDQWVENILETPRISNEVEVLITELLDQRDSMWRLLSELLYKSKVMVFASFDETEFVVQWQWFHEVFKKLCETSYVDGQEKLAFIVQAINEAIFGTNNPLWSHETTRKKMLRPHVPQKATWWEETIQLKSISDSCSLDENVCFDPFEATGAGSCLSSDINTNQVNLSTLLKVSHPVLYMTAGTRTELLGAICTTHLPFYGLSDQTGNNVMIKWVSEIKFSSKMKKMLFSLQQKFNYELSLSRVDLSIDTVENQLFDAEGLESLRDKSDSSMTHTEAYSKLKRDLLGRFSAIQISAIAEYWCSHQEISLCSRIAEILLEESADIKGEKGIHLKLKDMIPQMKLLVDVAVADTTWSVDDLRPVQALIWVSDMEYRPRNEGMSYTAFVRSQLADILSKSTKHCTMGSFVKSGAISFSLEMPDLFSNEDEYLESSSMAPVPSVSPLRGPHLFGSARLNIDVMSEVLVNMVGEQFSLSMNVPFKFYTVENANTRCLQQQMVCRMLSEFSLQRNIRKSNVFIYNYLLYDILLAVKETTGDSSMDSLIGLVCDHRTFHAGTNEVLEKAIGMVDNVFFSLYGSTLVSPLLKMLLQVWQEEDSNSSTFTMSCAYASIYLGLLRLTIFVPDSPIDPGEAPIAKISVIERKINEIRTHIAARKLHHGFTKGNFTPQDPVTESLETKSEILIEEQVVQQGEVIERIASAPPFHDLFQTTNDFINAMADGSSLTDIVRSLKDTIELGEPNLSLQGRVSNWQETAAAFIRKIMTDFVGYEDITSPIAHSIQMIQDGLCQSSDLVDKGTDLGPASTMETLYGKLIRFPLQCSSSAFSDLVETVKLAKSQNRMSPLNGRSMSVSNITFDNILIAILSRLLQKKTVSGITDAEYITISKLFCGLSKSLDGLNATSHEDNGSTLEDMFEKDFRQQFPDHRKDFHNLLKYEHEEYDMEQREDDDDDDDDDEADKSMENSPDGGVMLTDAQLDVLYRMYLALYSRRCSPTSADSARKLAFHLSYVGANEIHKAIGASALKNQGCDSNIRGGHMFALCLNSIPSTPMTRMHPYFLSSSKIVDFQNEPCPTMAMAAAAPLEALVARTTQLLNAFPGHSILVGLYKICDKVNKLNLATTPIGKIMTGLEVVLKQAQDWEQHASERVQIGSPLIQMGSLISQWRKYELESWSNLVEARRLRFARRAQRHWKYLHGVLLSDCLAAQPDIGDISSGTATRCQSSPINGAPLWIWKGSIKSRLESPSWPETLHTEDLKELVKTLDTFMLTSSLGEFDERLSILECLGSELMKICKTCNNVSPWTLQKSRTVRSIWRHYDQYSTFLAEKLSSLRSPIEASLKSETKLAKWDTQSYYALAESTERNHRRLMKILSEFDESLRLNVGVLIQEDSIFGLRSSPDSHDEFSTQYPSTKQFFPFGGVTESLAEMDEQLRLPRVETAIHPIVPVDLSLLGEEVRLHVSKISQYSRRMASMEKRLLSDRDTISAAKTGSALASSLCEAMFERIISLRNKATRPMKERALVELFRELKLNGLASTAWSTPKEVKQMENLFLVPSPTIDYEIDETASLQKHLERGEKYYLKCASEIHSLRSETLHLGSRHMTKRQMEIMVNLAGSGLYMLVQQRSSLSTLLYCRSDLHRLVGAMNFGTGNLPQNQSKLRNDIKVFNERHNAAYESLRQCSLLLRSSTSLMESEAKVSWVRDTISLIESLVADHTQVYSQEFNDFVTLDKLQSVADDQKRLEEVVLTLSQCRVECERLSCLPLDVFDCCLSDVILAIESATTVCDSIRLSDSDKSTDQPDCVASFSESLSLTIERILLTYQNLQKSIETNKKVDTQQPSPDEPREERESIRDCHQDLILCCASIDVRKLNESILMTMDRFRAVYDNGSATSRESQECCGRLVSNTRVLLTYLQHLLDRFLADMLEFYASNAKMNYVVVRIFRVLVAKGFCSDEEIEGDGDEEGDTKGMTFDDDNDGTGMGEGDGKKDVTDQIENEDQLAGLKNDKENQDENEQPQDRQQLNEEDAEQGMEMEGDFDGEMFDLPERPPDNNEEKEEDDGEEELDRQMGEDASPDEEVVDEKMWNESDDEDDIKEDEEKFEEGSGVEGDAIEGAMRTKDDEDGDDESPSPDDKKQGNDQQAPKDDQSIEGNDESEDKDTRDEINEDFEDNYEEQHGVDVRAEENDQSNGDPEDENDANEIDLDENIDLDGNADEQNDDEKENPEDILPDPDEGANEAEGGTTENVEDDEEQIPENEDEQDDDDDTQNVVPMNHGIGDNEQDSPNDQNEDEDDMDREEKPEPPDPSVNDENNERDAHGVKSMTGSNANVDDNATDEDDNGEEEPNDSAGNPSDGVSSSQPAGADGDVGQGFNDQAADESPDSQQNKRSEDVPNPFKNPGDASKFWHRRLNVIDSQDDPDQDQDQGETEGDKDQNKETEEGDFEYSSNPADETQVLGETTQDEADELDLNNGQHDDDKDAQPKENSQPKNDEHEDKNHRNEKKKRQQQKLSNQSDLNNIDDGTDEKNNDEGSLAGEMDVEKDLSETGSDDGEEDDEMEDVIEGPTVVTDPSRLDISDQANPEEALSDKACMLQEEFTTKISIGETEQARSDWLNIQGETTNLSRRLCEKLRLVMEPLVASKLRGDYRTGKRINMKKVIGYIASGYRKDKIWLRRTKPAKRDYRVLLAVDDSESMLKSGAGAMALRAMATVAVGMNQLEVGEVGVASFGDDMKLVHPFHTPFTPESGADVVRNFKFDQPRTRMSFCVESAMAALEDAGGGGSSMQLVFLISDGRIERDSRSELKRLIREMTERNILIAMIIVEGTQVAKKDSILNMKEVTFEKGKPRVKSFMEDYPFPYYIVLDNVSSLPEVLGDALKQWFEVVAQLQSN